jgi:hypothetical protein
MRVRCIQLPSSAATKAGSRSPWLTLGREYVVLSVLADTAGRVFYRLLSDDQRTPALFGATQFEVTSTNIPKGWCLWVPEEGGLELSPAAWLTPGFWESYFDAEEEALRVFNAELTTILAS